MLVVLQTVLGRNYFDHKVVRVVLILSSPTIIKNVFYNSELSQNILMCSVESKETLDDILLDYSEFEFDCKKQICCLL